LGAISLQPTGNEQGGYFHRLNSSKKYAWTEFPMPNEVVAQVHRLAITAENYEGIVLTYMNGNILSEQFTDEETAADTESETYKDQQPTGVGTDMAIGEESANMIDNNQITELDDNGIECITDHNDDDNIEGNIQHNGEDEYTEEHTEQEAVIKTPIKHEKE